MQIGKNNSLPCPYMYVCLRPVCVIPQYVSIMLTWHFPHDVEKMLDKYLFFLLSTYMNIHVKRNWKRTTKSAKIKGFSKKISIFKPLFSTQIPIILVVYKTHWPNKKCTLGQSAISAGGYCSRNLKLLYQKTHLFSNYSLIL